jgi:Domain of unknown function (DUF1989)
MKLGFETRGPGAGAAFFAWAQRDPFEQFSDAYTFMELRWARPRVGDSLYSTLRRPIVTIQRDDAGQSVDLLRHDVWWLRDQYVCLLSKEAAARSVPAPELPDWPFAVNLFARTLVGVMVCWRRTLVRGGWREDRVDHGIRRGCWCDSCGPAIAGDRGHCRALAIPRPSPRCLRLPRAGRARQSANRATCRCHRPYQRQDVWA